jgi:SsrA-binding protein
MKKQDAFHTQNIQNNHAGFHYEILEKYTGGIALLGNEVKSLRMGHASLGESFIVMQDNEFFLVKAYIAPYQIKNNVGYDPYRKRKILIHKKELRELVQKKSAAGLTLIPLALYTDGRFIKVHFALVRGKQKHDKRETIKKRDADRAIQRLMKS